MRRFILDDSPERLEVFCKRFPDCVTATNYKDAIKMLKANKRFDEIWLDHDLGESHNGCDVAYWIATSLNPLKFPAKAIVHSWNPAGAKAIALTLQGVGIDVEVAPFNPNQLY